MTTQEEYELLKELQSKHPHIKDWISIRNMGKFCERREAHRPAPSDKYDERFDWTINGRIPVIDK